MKNIAIYLLILFAIIAFLLFNLVKDSQNSKYKIANEHAAQQWCNDLKVNCNAIKCIDNHDLTICDVHYDNHLISLDCNTDYCVIRNLSK